MAVRAGRWTYGRYELHAGGTYSAGGAPRGNYVWQDGVLRLDDNTGLCNGSSSGIYVTEFDSSCGQVTLRLVHDGCRVRSEAFDG